MRSRSGSTEATHDQVVIFELYYVPDRHVLEQITVFVQDVVRPGAHLSSASVHGPSLTILQPRLVPWEEVSDHVLYA